MLARNHNRIMDSKGSLTLASPRFGTGSNTGGELGIADRKQVS